MNALTVCIIIASGELSKTWTLCLPHVRNYWILISPQAISVSLAATDRILISSVSLLWASQVLLQFQYYLSILILKSLVTHKYIYMFLCTYFYVCLTGRQRPRLIWTKGETLKIFNQDVKNRDISAGRFATESHCRVKVEPSLS